MALTAYEAQTNRLLRNPSYLLFAQADVDYWINLARSQVALESESVQRLLTPSASTQSIALSAISVSGITGAASVAVVRAISITGMLLDFRPWNWFFVYNQTVVTGVPKIWSQQNAGGDIYFWPSGTSVTLKIDAVLRPIDLANDSTTELLLWPWTDAVPFLAAHFALMNAQRYQDAEAMYQMYERWMRRSRQLVTPSELPMSWPGQIGTAMARAGGTLTVPLEQPSGGGR